MPVVLVLILSLFLARVCSADEPSLAIVQAGVERSEDAPFVSHGYRFLPGEYLYLTYQIAGFAAASENRGEVRKISLSYEATAEDQAGIALAQPASGEIETELAPEDKNWLPKRRASFLLPSFVAAGDFHVHLVVKDLVAKTQISKDLPFRIGGVEIQPSTAITIENFHFLRNENDENPLEVPAYQPGDKVFARFVMTGYRLGPRNQYHLSYGITVLRPDGKPFVEQTKAAELEAESFYPAQFVPGVVALITPSDTPRGQYVIVLTARDLISGQSYTGRQAFSIE
jgi:hypothetical protein